MTLARSWRTGSLALCVVVGCDDVFDLVEVSDERLDAATADGETDAAPVDPALVFHFPHDQLDAGITVDTIRALEALCLSGECPTLVQGRLGFALDFNGSSDMLHVETANELETTTAFTVTAWVLQEQALFTDDHGCIVNKRFGTTFGNTWQLCVHDPQGIGFMSHNGTASDFMYSASWPLGVWHHIAATWDGSTKRLFVDGTMRTFKTAMIAFDGGSVTIGADIDNAIRDAPFPGLIDEVRLYNRALDPFEILQLAQ
jgi:hypothetical protein